ncbi:BspA family leucine-rich repeat surface protein [Enterococcus sp. AZ128]|uniref:BspA family leucine-rich repeat surface protein n=1 Tax=unclassified Enterococcus TaxID=2608891 RepID=UPI003F6871AB
MSESTIDADEAVTVEDTDPSIDLIDEPILEVNDQTVPEEAFDLEKQDEPVEIEDNSISLEEADSEENDETIIIDSGELPDGGWTLYEDGTLIITGTIKASDFEKWASYTRMIRAIKISEATMVGNFTGVFLIGEQVALYSVLESFEVKHSVWQDVTSMKGFFKYLYTLKRVTFTNTILDTDSDIDMKEMFSLCSRLIEVDLSSFNTNSVTDTSSMFNGCSSLTGLDLSDLNTGSVTDMSSMFYGCSSLTGLDLSDLNTGSVTDMSSMFNGCSSLTGLDVSNLNTSSVTDMSYMFSGCSSLTGLDVSNFNTSSVTDMSYMFSGCSSLTGLDVSNFNTSSVTDMSYMFSGCSSLTGLDVSNLNTSSVTDMSSMFSGCSSLTGLDLSNLNTGSVTDMSSMFSGCSSLTELDLSNLNTGSVTDMSSMFNRCSSLTELDVSNLNTGSVTDMSYMFSGCSSLTGLDVSNLNTGSVTDMSYMFNGCRSLTGLDVSNLNTGSVTDMSSMFNGCRSLTELDVSNLNTGSVTGMRSMFSSCMELTELDLSNFDTSKVSDMSYMFFFCYGLTKLDLSSFNRGAATQMFPDLYVMNLTLIVSKDFKFTTRDGLSELYRSSVWQEENNKELFYSTDDMKNYHNDKSEKNTYRIMDLFEMKMNSQGGHFEDGSEIRTQGQIIGEKWEMLIPTKENFQFDGWYLDKAYKNKFDFDQPASKNETIYAKWIENYTVTIPEKIDLNSDSDLLISGINNGDKSLNVTIKHEESQINQSRMLKLTNQMDESISANVQLEWENELSDEWTILTIPADSVPVSKDSEVKMIKPKDIQAGDYSGQIFFSIRYE